jgi:hypothetical protein
MSANTGSCICWCVFWIALFGCIAFTSWADAYKKAPVAPVVCEATK